MDWGSLYGNSEIAKQLAQYPDVQLYNAAKLLEPEDRPVYPVRLLGKTHPLWRARPNADAMTDSSNKKIYIARDHPNYRDPNTLASMLGHEAVHSKGDLSEKESYLAQIRIATALGLDSEYIDKLRRNVGRK